MSAVPSLDPSIERWQRLEGFGETFSCYSSAIAAWTALEHESWSEIVNPGLGLTIEEAGGGLLRFAGLRAGLRADLGLVRTGCDDPLEAAEGVLEEIARSGRAIIAGDGFNQPWHVAVGRAHVPHWFVIADGAGELRVVDPFACRNELGLQKAHREVIAREQLPSLLGAIPAGNRIFELRETLAFGDDAGPLEWWPYQWFVAGRVQRCRALSGAVGSDAVRRLAEHFHEHGGDLEAYGQADDIWSIGRHRAFLARHANEIAQRRADPGLAAWVAEHAAPLAKRWAHVAPLMMQARLALEAGRSASGSLSQTLEELASREELAASSLPVEFYVANN